MRVAVLPRDEAARVITGATSRSAWMVNAANLALTIPVLVEFFVTRGVTAALWLPLGIVVGMLGLAIAASLRPRPWVVVGFLVVGGLGTFGYELALLAAVPGVGDDALFLLNRPAVSLVLVSVEAASWVGAIAWIASGYVVSLIVSAAVAVTTSTTLRVGLGPSLMLALYVVAFTVLAVIQIRARRRVPDFDRFEAETQRAEVQENLNARVTAAVHDTLLNDLSIIMNAPDRLDERVTARLRDDLRTLTSAEWLRETPEVVLDDQDSDMRNKLMMMISDLQWRGLTVHVTGSGTGIYRLAPEVETAVIDAIRACLENVLRHAGTPVAEVDLAYGDDEVTVIVSDEGVGFDSEAVPDDRLGIRYSIVERIQSVGGSVRVWSSPGAGTSVIVRVPVLEILTPHEEATHGQD